MVKNENIISKITELINLIQNEKIIILIIDNNISKFLNILQIYYKKIPYNIKYYTHQLITIKTNTKCINCSNNAEYVNIHNENEMYCWKHSHFI